MALGINLAPIDTDSVSYVETDPNKIGEFTASLSHADAIHAASRLLETIKVLNRQNIPVETRIACLELYRKITHEICSELEDDYLNAPIPLPDSLKIQASLAEAIWLETGYGYKRALVDLKQKLFVLNTNKQSALVIFRAMEALKNEAYVNYLTYSYPSETIWSDLHKLYYHALQLAIEEYDVNEHTLNSNNKTINAVYIQVLLMHLASPQRLEKSSIKKLMQYVASLSKYAQLRGIGLIENPVGVFLIELDSHKPPVAYLKNYNIPNMETDILLLTVDVARHIHQQLKYLQENTFTSGSQLPTLALEIVDEDLLKHLIKYFGVTPFRNYSRLEKNHIVELSIGLEATNIVYRDNKRKGPISYSEWEVLNISPTGYALKTKNPSGLVLNIGDIVAIKEQDIEEWLLGSVIWLSMKSIHLETEHIEMGIQLIAPSAKTVQMKNHPLGLDNMLLLPEIAALNENTSIVAARGNFDKNTTYHYDLNGQSTKFQIKDLIDRSTYYERFEISLI